MTRRAIAVPTIGAGALLVVLGSLFPLYGQETHVRPGVNGPLPEGLLRSVALTGWEYLQEPALSGRSAGVGFDFPVYGHGLVLGAVLAGAGALLQLRSARWAAVGRFGVLAAFGLVVGTLWAAVETLRTVFGVDSGASPAVTTSEFVGAGTWLVGVAAVVLLVGAVLAQEWPPRLPRATGLSVYQVDDDATPPFGIAMPVSEEGQPSGGAGQPGGAVPPGGAGVWGGGVSPGGGGSPGGVVPPVAELPPAVEWPGAGGPAGGGIGSPDRG
ncbi:hypothetical protein ACIGNX_26545 [Actinosynnema sp. NPDC053489]|uniref:hypothetical protein n=1 Tax=Actinosynnema sp. NPDC053489 TaxID=3363916 RepID=UPI0037CA5399